MSARMVQIGGDHYATKAVQPWDAMECWMTAEQFEGYLRGCALKYLARYPDKDGLQDVRKAAHYLQRLIEVLEAQELRDIDDMVRASNSVLPEDAGACGNVGREEC